MSKVKGRGTLWVRCRARSCSEKIHDPRLFCDRHWAALPHYIQEGIWLVFFERQEEKHLLTEWVEKAFIWLMAKEPPTPPAT